MRVIILLLLSILSLNHTDAQQPTKQQLELQKKLNERILGVTNEKNRQVSKDSIKAEPRWTGTVTFTETITISNAAYSAKSERHITGYFNGALPTLYRNDPTTELNFTDDKGNGVHTYHAEGKFIGGRTCITDCQSSDKAELHAVIINEEEGVYDIEMVSPTCVGTICSEDGNGTKEYIESRSVTVANYPLGDNKEVLTGTIVRSAMLEPADLGTTVTNTTTWYLKKAGEDVEPCTACGSVIGIENQSLGQTIIIAGTDFSLHYRSDRFHSKKELAGWTISPHHQLFGNHLFLGNNKLQELPNGPMKYFDQIPGIDGPGGYSVTSVDGTELFVFDNSGYHLRTLDRLTGALIYLFQYDLQKNLISITDAFGLVTVIERNPGGLPVAIIGPYGHKTTFTLDDSRNLINITSPSGEKTTFSYSPSGLLTGMVDPRGFKHAYLYDASGKLIKDQDPSGTFTTLSRTINTNGYTVALGTASGQTAKYSVVNQAGGIRKRIAMFFDGTKNTGTTWPDGRRTVEFGDGTLATIIDNPETRGNNQTTVQSLSVKFPSGLESTLKVERSVSLNLPKQDDITGHAETLSLNGRPFTISYNVQKRAVAVKMPTGRSIIATLNTAGRIIETQTGGLAPVRITYDNNGRPVMLEKGISPDTRRYQLTYDSGGNLKSITDPLGQTNNFFYDASGRINKTILPDGRILSAAYDAMGNLTTFLSAGQASHNFEYDNTSHITKYSPPAVGSSQLSTLYKYNTDHQVTGITRPDGQEINYTYNSAGCNCGKLNSLILPYGKTTFRYNSATGRLTEIISPKDIKLSLTFDGPLLTKEAWSGAVSGFVTRRYNNDLQVVAHLVNDNPPITYVYDADGLLIQTGDMVITRSPLNSLVSGTTLGGVKENRLNNSFGEITRSEMLFNGTPLLKTEYSRDALGRITRKVETFGGVTNEYRYSYDMTGRLITVEKNGVTTASYTYDDNNNLVKLINANGELVGKYDDQDRIISYGNLTFTFTGNGELLSKTTPYGTTKYKYDALGNLQQVNLPDSTLIEYILDGHNRRVGKKIKGTIVQEFLYLDGLRIAADLDGSGKIVSRFIYGTRINVPDYMIKEGVSYRIISDHIGSPRLIVDTQTGTIAQELAYDEFGNVLSDTRPGFQPFGFAGSLYDNDTELCQFGVRDYDAYTGRWTTKDPIRLQGMSSNFYQYAAGDPVNRIDPLGLQSVLAEEEEMVCSWDAARRRGEKEVKALDQFRGTKGERYGMETEGGSEIDMRHYTAAYNTVQKLGGKGSYYAFWVSQLLGLGMEFSQCLQDSKSALDASDFLSNFKGALDAFQGNTPIAGTPSGPNGYLKF